MKRGFFEERDGLFVPDESGRGPWGDDTLHGRLIAGLFAHVLEQEHGDPAFHFARLTFDMFRMPRIAPIAVVTETVREGGRIRVVAARMTSQGRELARSQAVLLRRGEMPDGEVWKPADWSAPHPETIEPRPVAHPTWKPMWDTRAIGESFGGTSRKGAWLRETHTLVEGHPLTPLTRVAVAADFTSPIANSGSSGLHYVNADITLYLHRLPRDEWIGFDVASHQASEGVAIADCTLYDLEGPIGKCGSCAVANPA